ncbi:MAG: hypothetical protein SFU20_00875 [Chitinophagaceae bacterium]|nr:hypothetical protein [Chitinophagaceae bacterium]
MSNPVTYFIISILSALIIILGGIQAMNNAKKQDEQIDTLQSQLAKSLDISEKLDSNTKDIKDIQEKFSRLLRQESEKADKYKQERLLESKDYFASTFRHINSRITSLVVHSYFRDFQYFDITRNEAKEIFKLFLSLKENIFRTETLT